MCGILSIFVQYFRVQKIHLETRRKINLYSDELNGGSFSHRLIFCRYSSIGSNYWLNQCWETRIDPIYRRTGIECLQMWLYYINSITMHGGRVASSGEAGGHLFVIFSVCNSNNISPVSPGKNQV